MSDLAFWKAVVADTSNFLERVTDALANSGLAYCVIGGVAVNAYAEPVLTQDLDVVVAATDLKRIRALMEAEFRVREFEHSLNVYDPDSRLQVQFQLDPALSAYLAGAEMHDVLGLRLPVARPRDLMAAKVAAALEPKRRPSKRLKDLADIRRLLDTFPDLEGAVPPEILARITFP